MKPGEYFLIDEEIELNKGWNTIELQVSNAGDRPIQDTIYTSYPGVGVRGPVTPLPRPSHYLAVHGKYLAVHGKYLAVVSNLGACPS